MSGLHRGQAFPGLVYSTFTYPALHGFASSTLYWVVDPSIVNLDLVEELSIFLGRFFTGQLGEPHSPRDFLSIALPDWFLATQSFAYDHLIKKVPGFTHFFPQEQTLDDPLPAQCAMCLHWDTNVSGRGRGSRTYLTSLKRSLFSTHDPSLMDVDVAMDLLNAWRFLPLLAQQYVFPPQSVAMVSLHRAPLPPGESLDWRYDFIHDARLTSRVMATQRRRLPHREAFRL